MSKQLFLYVEHVLWLIFFVCEVLYIIGLQKLWENCTDWAHTNF